MVSFTIKGTVNVVAVTTERIERIAAEAMQARHAYTAMKTALADADKARAVMVGCAERLRALGVDIDDEASCISFTKESILR